ncbi:BQ5605_C008g05090 [Microbotryum silenes-dioicae]|uniref:BQ5605_C008g05090 protein n=1 Tax=Microbotryum silenes-dioicae TaxID=796604 RepID=A0A2X0MG95_9BASI|nr:BQ5605_C008g05090 [Microbotryum silenes-dioicae]
MQLPSPPQPNPRDPLCSACLVAFTIVAVNQRPAFAQTWLIDSAEDTDTRLGPDTKVEEKGSRTRGDRRPHARILFSIAPDNHPLSTEAIDKMISAEIPNPWRYPELHEAITKHMLHGNYGGNILAPHNATAIASTPSCSKSSMATMSSIAAQMRSSRSAKEGISVVLLRNLDTDAGLCNGTRLIVSNAKSRVILTIVLTGDRAGTTAPIPRVRLETSATSRRQLGFTMRRLQFPLRVALAMTINKAQGQSLDPVGVDLSLHPVFTHGQLYVALSRAMSVDRIKALHPSRDPAEDALMTTTCKPSIELQPRPP